jgi:hypothetical protein
MPPPTIQVENLTYAPNTNLSEKRIAEIKDRFEDDSISAEEVKTLLDELNANATSAHTEWVFGFYKEHIGKDKLQSIRNATIAELDALVPDPKTGGRVKTKVSQRTSRTQTRRRSSRHPQRQRRHRSLLQPTRRR